MRFIAALRGLKISEQGFRNSVKKVDWPARSQNLRTGPLVKMVKDFHSKNEIWLDGGHNMAAGQAMANNRFPIVIPCHRVIASDGSLGGFAG